jgi:hypothetical protein
VSLATSRGAAYWDHVFTVADQVDRADPARANLAPLRTRITLLATAARTRLEADLWPHLRGLTIGLLASAPDVGFPDSAIVALHMDGPTSAQFVGGEILPRLSALWRGGKERAALLRAGSDPARVLDPAAPLSLGAIGGRPLDVAVRGRTVIVGWGRGALAAALDAAEHRERSVLNVLRIDVHRLSVRAPDRLGAFWPGRMRLPIAGLDGPTPLARVLAEGPPIIWQGWDHEGRTEDLVCWSDLRPLVHCFLASIPLEPSKSP